MANRREFLGATVAASAMVSFAGGAFAAPLALAGRPLARAVVDNRFAAARGFAEVMAARGVPVSGFDGDLTDLWRDDIDVRWRTSREAIAGMTDYRSFFCLEQFARDHAMRVVYRGVHSEDGAGYATHELSGPSSLILRKAVFEGTSNRWGATAARLLVDAPAGREAKGEARVLTAGQRRGESMQLYSWVIAPAEAI